MHAVSQRHSIVVPAKNTEDDTQALSEGHRLRLGPRYPAAD